MAQPDPRSAMGNSPSADLGGGSTHSSRDVRTTNPEMEVKRSSASRAPTHNEYNELPASSKPHILHDESTEKSNIRQSTHPMSYFGVIVQERKPGVLSQATKVGDITPLFSDPKRRVSHPTLSARLSVCPDCPSVPSAHIS